MTARNERTTCTELIEPALSRVGWGWEQKLRIGPGRVNLTGTKFVTAFEEMTDEEDRKMVERDALERVNYLLQKIGVV